VLPLLIERQRNARLAEQVQITEYRAAADTAFLRQRLSVAPSANLQQTNQL
jgi:hypothetical protein